MKKEVNEKNKVKVEYREYNEFVKQLEISDIRIVSARMESLSIKERPLSANISVRTKAWYENGEGEFDVSERYNMTIKDPKINKAMARFSVIFCVAYTSKIPMNDEIFEIFEIANLPLNTWPYFREFAHSSFTRMGWVDIVAPLYKTL